MRLTDIHIYLEREKDALIRFDVCRVLAAVLQRFGGVGHRMVLPMLCELCRIGCE